MTERVDCRIRICVAKPRADPEVEARIEGLRRKANEGMLTPEEDAEYKDFVEPVDIVSIMPAKARRFFRGRLQC